MRFPLNYNCRTARFGHTCLVTCYIMPAIFFAIILNIPRLVEIGNSMQDSSTNYLTIYMYYQVGGLNQKHVFKKKKSYSFA